MKPLSYRSEREVLADRARSIRTSLAWLSRALGRRDRYLDRFAAGGPPVALSPADREWLALFFGVPDSAMGIPSTRG
jgi:repressor LexA